MRLVYFDCPSGISGNMIIGALLDAGLEASYLKKELLKLQTSNFKLQNKYQLLIHKTKKQGLAGTYFNVKIAKHDQQRGLKDILRIIRKSRLSKEVKALSTRIFRRLAEAEAKVHGIPVNKIHFHEIGAVDAIIDIVGACIGFEKLGIERIFCSPLPNGKGRIIHAHGLLLNPAPAAAELLKGVPTYGAGIKGELVTPTGAAIVTTLAAGFGDLPKVKLETIGYGAGTIDLPVPNLLRLFIGEAELPAETDMILQIETNIDDMAPGRFPAVIKKLMQAGALDAAAEPILMKKERAATRLVVLAEPEDKDKILETLFDQTTTLGARLFLVRREKLSRGFIRVGKARVKLGFLGSRLKVIAPEYEDYKRIARKHHVPVKLAHRELIRRWRPGPA